MELSGTFISTLGELREAIANTEKVVVVYFYTEWSPACRKIRFEFMQAAENHPDIVYLAANMDRAKSMAGNLGITLDNIPALVVFKNALQIYTATLITAEDFNKMDFTAVDDRVESATAADVIDSKSS